MILQSKLLFNTYSCSFRRIGQLLKYTAFPQRDVTTNAAVDVTKDMSEQQGPKFTGPLYDKLYPGHISATWFQKALLSVGSLYIALTRPERDDMIATCAEASGHNALISIRRKMLADPVGRQILHEKPIINSSTVDLHYLRTLPPDTFGNTYVTWLDTNGVTPDSRKPVQFVDDVELAYVMLRYRQVHDLYHTLLGMPTNMLGEITIKWVEAIQTGLPMCTSTAILAPPRLKSKHFKHLMFTNLPWAIAVGFRAKFLMSVYFEKHWEVPVAELQKQLNIDPPPYSPPLKGSGEKYRA